MPNCLWQESRLHHYHWRMCSGVTSQQHYQHNIYCLCLIDEMSEHAKHNIPASSVKQRLPIKVRIPHLPRVGSCRNYTGDGVFIASTARLKNVLVTTRHSGSPQFHALEQSCDAMGLHLRSAPQPIIVALLITSSGMHPVAAPPTASDATILGNSPTHNVDSAAISTLYILAIELEM